MAYIYISKYKSNTSTALTERIVSNPISLYPNPTSNELTIDTEQKISEVSIIDITGKIIMITKQNTKTINVSDLSNGLYFIKLSTGERTITKKFLKQ